MLSREAPDIVVIDIGLPGGSGIDLLRQLRLAGSNAFVVVMTNHSIEPYLQACLAAGADAFLDKATGFEDLLELTARLAAEPGRAAHQEMTAVKTADHPQPAGPAATDAEALLDLVLDSAPAGVWQMDPSTRRFAWSASLRRLLFLPPEARETMANFLSAVHPDDRALVERAVGDALERREEAEAEFRIQCPDGKVGWARSRMVWHGRPNRLVGVVVDLTERKHLLSQLQHAQRMDALGKLASGMAHDFNNLLTAIVGYSELMKASLDPDGTAQEDLDEILKAANRATGLTRQLLTFSRQQVLQPQALNLNEVIADTTKMLQRLIGEDIELVAHLEPGLHAVNADTVQIAQVLVNLAVNARDAMPSGGRLTLETRNVHVPEGQHGGVVPAGSYVLTAVTDTGTAMDAETRERIFEPFFTTKGAGEGTGLGLSTVYGIVKQNRGFIWVYSEQGLGTAFRIYLPRLGDQQARQPRTGRPQAARLEEAPARSSRARTCCRSRSRATCSCGPSNRPFAAPGPEGFELIGAAGSGRV